MKNLENGSNSSKAHCLKLVISKISIRIKFNCWLFIEYTIEGITKRTNEIKVDPKQKNYSLQEEIRLNADNTQRKQDQILIYVKLISSKGVSFTAGIFTITPKYLTKQGSTFRCPLTKPIDPQSYVQYYISSPLKEEHCVQTYSPSHPSHYLHLKSVNPLPQEFGSNHELKLKIKELQLELESVRAAYELMKLRNSRQIQQKFLNGTRETLVFSKDYKMMQELLQEARQHEKQHLNRIQNLEVQQSKFVALSQKQKEIIQMLQAAEKHLAQEKAELKAQLKSNQNELDEKRQRIRQLQSQKLNLMMNVLTTQKEISFMRERAYESIQKLYKVATKITKDKNQQWSANKLASLSASGWRKEGQSQTSYKMNTPTHRYIMRDDLPWLQYSQAYKQMPGQEMSSSSAMNDISISNIKEKNKEEISLLNSEMFVKGGQKLSKVTQNHILKSVTDQVRLYTSKISQMLTSYHVRCQRQLAELRQTQKQLCQNNHQYQRNQQSLLGHLQQLEGGLQSQLQLVNNKERALKSAQQAINCLQFQLQEKNQLIFQLQAAIFKLEEQKQELQRDIHENNYTYAKRQEQLMLSFKKLQISPTKNISPFSLIKSKRQIKKQTVYSSRQLLDTHYYEKQILQFKEKVKTLELQLSHQRHQAKQLRHVLQISEGERHKLQFAIKLKQRMQILNQSIEVSREQGQCYSDQRQEAGNAYQQQILKVLI